MAKLENCKTGIIGAGNMGAAIISALAAKVDPGNIYVCEKDSSKTGSLPSGINIETSPAALTTICDIIIVAVKPDAVSSVLEELKSEGGPVIVSVAAGLTISFLEDVIGKDREIIRVMPNTPLSIGMGMSVLCANSRTTPENMDAVTEIFNSAGRAVVLPEKLMDGVTGVSGSGPALVFTFIQAIADAGVKAGLPRKEAVELASQTVAGAARMVLETGKHPDVLRDQVASPGGTTIEAIHVLEKAGFSGTVMDAVEAAVKKSAGLGGS